MAIQFTPGKLPQRDLVEFKYLQSISSRRVFEILNSGRVQEVFILPRQLLVGMASATGAVMEPAEMIALNGHIAVMILTCAMFVIVEWIVVNMFFMSTQVMIVP